METERMTVVFGPAPDDLALAKQVRQEAGKGGMNRYIKNALRLYLFTKHAVEEVTMTEEPRRSS